MTDELTLIGSQVREVDDRRRGRSPGAARRSLVFARAPGREGRRGDQPVQRHRPRTVPSAGGGNAAMSNTPTCAAGGSVHLADTPGGSRFTAGAPRVLRSSWRAARSSTPQRLSGDADQAQTAHDALDLVAQRLGLGVPGQRRRASEPTRSGARPPPTRGCRSSRPRRPSCPVALGVQDQRRDAGGQGLSSSTIPSPVLPEPVMPTITPWVVRSAGASSTGVPSVVPRGASQPRTQRSGRQGPRARAVRRSRCPGRARPRASRVPRDRGAR